MYVDDQLDCGVCRLRPFHAQDAPALARHADNPRVARYPRDRFPHPYAVEDARRFFDYATHTDGECVACIEVEDQAAGAIGIIFRTDIERCSAELGYWLGEPFWGRGVVTAAIQTFAGWAMPRSSLTRIYAEVFAENRPSASVLEKSGFERVGVLRKAAIKNKVHHDYILYDLVR